MENMQQDDLDFTGLRRYEQKYCSEIIQLFYETVHTINAKDYSSKQLNVWAPKEPNIEKWNSSLESNYTVVCFISGKIVGFADMTTQGYLNRLYVSKDFQRCGIASLLVKALELYAQSLGEKEITTDASITAKPFFEKQCYKVIKKQQVERQGVLLTNFVMKKEI